MNGKQKILMIFGFQLASVNYLISDYLMPSLVCMIIAFVLSVATDRRTDRRGRLIGLGFSLIINLAIFFCGIGIMSAELRNIAFKLAISQSVIEGGILIRLCRQTDESFSLLKYTGVFYLILCLLIFVIPNDILNYFLYSGMKGNGAMQLFILCSEIFIPLLSCSIVGLLYNELAIKKEPNHFFGSIK